MWLFWNYSEVLKIEAKNVLMINTFAAKIILSLWEIRCFINIFIAPNVLSNFQSSESNSTKYFLFRCENTTAMNMRQRDSISESAK